MITITRRTAETKTLKINHRHHLIFMIMDSIFAIPFILEIIFDIMIIKSKEKIFEYKFTFLEVIKFQIIYEILLIVNYINGSLKRYNWK